MLLEEGNFRQTFATLVLHTYTGRL